MSQRVLRAFGTTLGIDRAVFLTLVGRVWGVGAGLVTIFFVTTALSPVLQGYYYTFYSLIALQVFAELGLNYAIVQFGSHEMARLGWSPSGVLQGEAEARRRLQSLLHFALVWYGVAALLMVVVLLPFGIWVFARAAGGVLDLSITVPWALLVVFSALALLINACTALLEACGRVAEMALVRLSQSMAASVAVWSVLAGGGGLHAVAAGCAMMVLAAGAWLAVKFRPFFTDLLCNREGGAGLAWRDEIWPFQWRIAISVMSGYLITQLFNPFLLASHGPVVAGQMGMSLQMTAAMNGAALAWITTKAPVYGQLIATHRRRDLDALFFRSLLQSSLVLVGGIVTVLVGLYALSASGTPHAARVLPYPEFALLCLACLANHFVVAEAVYLRAHKQEPFMVLAVANGVGTASLAAWLIPPLGSLGAVLAYTVTSLVVGLGGGTLVFVIKRRQWSTPLGVAGRV